MSRRGRVCARASSIPGAATSSCRGLGAVASSRAELPRVVWLVADGPEGAQLEGVRGAVWRRGLWRLAATGVMNSI